MNILKRIYADHAATSPIHPKVIEKITDVLNNTFGNPSSTHFFGRQARQILDEAREVLAKSIQADASEIIITGSGTEADNHAIFGVAEAYKDKGKHIITTEVEHHAVLYACRYLEKQGYDVTYLPVDETGRIHLSDFEKALRDDTILVTIMYGNNEVGTLQPIKEISEQLANHQAVFHTDAVQAFGLEEIDVKQMGINLLSVAAHKINGPKGIGFLYVEKGLKLPSRMIGGDQERKRRAGTENVAYIAGFAEAVRIVQEDRDKRRQTYEEYKNIFMNVLRDNEVEFYQNGSLDHSLPHVLNLSFPGTNVESMLVNLDLAGIAASSGSACTAGTIEPSHVLVAMFGQESDRLQNSIRFSFGLYNTEEEIVQMGKETAKILKRLIK